MDGEIVTLMEQAGPYLTAALGAYGAGVLGRVEHGAVDATAHVGRRLLHAVWHRHGGHGRGALEAVVRDAGARSDDTEVVAVLCEHIRHAMREDAELLKELSALVTPAPAEQGQVRGERAGANGHATRDDVD